MDLGTAIREIRKGKGLSQKELAAKCGLSVNTMCQIEINNTFPQKATIKLICEVLEIPISYLLFFSISDEDLPEESQSIFKALSSPIRDSLMRDIKKSVSDA